MRLVLLLLLSPGPGRARREGLVVNRRARQPVGGRAGTSPSTEGYGYSYGPGTEEDSYSPRARAGDQGYSSISRTDDTGLSSVARTEAYAYRPAARNQEYGPRTRSDARYTAISRTEDRARTEEPRRSSQRSRSRVAVQRSQERESSPERARGLPEDPAPREPVITAAPRRVRARVRGRLPRRRGEEGPPAPAPRRRAQLARARAAPAPELYRDERAGVEPRVEPRVELRVEPRVELRVEPRAPRPRVRSRSRHRPVAHATAEAVAAEGHRLGGGGRGRGLQRGSLRAKALALQEAQGPAPRGAQGPAPRGAQGGPRIRFPKKNLFGAKARPPPRQNTIDSSPRAEAKPGRGRAGSEGIQPTKPARARSPAQLEELPRLQSGQQEEREVPTAITVTHQVPSRTVFTVVEAGETRSLFADTFDTSLEVVAVSDLKSTEIDSQRVVYAHVKTNLPAFGVTELEFEAIQPTRTYREEERSVVVDGSLTQLVDRLPSTVYNVEVVRTRLTAAPSLAAPGLGLEALSDPGQLGLLLQSVLLSILGGGILGRAPLQEPPGTRLVTHTRSFLTTATELETIQIPVNFRGSTIFQTVTEQKTRLVTATDYSVQTLTSPGPAPFLPLAPTLHRAARVVPASPPPLLPILHTAPPAIQTSLLTETETVTVTVTSLATSQLLLTLGGRPITTEIVEAVTKVVTSTVLSSQWVAVAPPSLPARPSTSLRQLQLLQAILRLRA